MPILKQNKTPHFILKGRNLIKSLSGFVEVLMLSYGPSVYVIWKSWRKTLLILGPHSSCKDSLKSHKAAHFSHDFLPC